MFYRDIKAEVPAQAGLCADDAAAKRWVSMAAELLTNKGVVDALTGEVAVCVCGHFATLPADVDTPLAIQVDASPTVMRNEWFTYHVNGPGDQDWTPCGFSDILGSNFPTIREPDRAVLLVTVLENAADENCEFIVNGLTESGEKAYSERADGTSQSGFYVPTLSTDSAPNADAPALVKIESVYKAITKGYIDLYGVDPTTNEVICHLGHYRPDETEPRYVRVRVNSGNVVRVKFKRKDFDIHHDDSWINIDSKLALVNAIKAVQSYMTGATAQGMEYEALATRFAKEKARSQRPPGLRPAQVIDNSVPVSRRRLIH
jgi:hypothetical protein